MEKRSTYFKILFRMVYFGLDRGGGSSVEKDALLLYFLTPCDK